MEVDENERRKEKMCEMKKIRRPAADFVEFLMTNLRKTIFQRKSDGLKWTEALLQL